MSLKAKGGFPRVRGSNRSPCRLPRPKDLAFDCNLNQFLEPVSTFGFRINQSLHDSLITDRELPACPIFEELGKEAVSEDFPVGEKVLLDRGGAV